MLPQAPANFHSTHRTDLHYPRKFSDISHQKETYDFVFRKPLPAPT